jgi:hypothetical protein
VPDIWIKTIRQTSKLGTGRISRYGVEYWEKDTCFYIYAVMIDRKRVDSFMTKALAEKKVRQLTTSEYVMRIGPIQKDILTYLKRCDENGGFIGPTTKASEFAGLDWKQIERALQSLLRRSIIRKEGIRYILN